ncbi:MAG: biopolymer transporter ExbD [Candidatus Symbiothrix sp.]|jgi:biopolymer transport protein ExbD|nr:biopolymer transporter ExbD [Candidatus Symbiothrix sp.]
MRYRKRKIPQINSSSTADIAFLLLIFFLITSSFDSMTGIYRKMNPAEAENILKKKRDIESRNLLSITIDENNQIRYGEQELTLPELKNMAKTFIANPNNAGFLPEKENREFPGTGTYPVTSKHNISLEISREARYQTYLSALNEITAAYNELRNETAISLFQKNFNQLTPEEQTLIREIFPQHITEKEPDQEKEGGRP